MEIRNNTGCRVQGAGYKLQAEHAVSFASYLTPHTSHLIPDTSYPIPYTPYLTLHT